MTTPQTRVSDSETCVLRREIKSRTLPTPTPAKLPIGSAALWVTAAMTQPRLHLVRSRDEFAAEIIDELDRTIDRRFTPTWERPSPDMKTRGVWVADFRDHLGNPVIQAINSAGAVAVSRPWLRGESLNEIRVTLSDMLNETDPL